MCHRSDRKSDTPFDRNKCQPMQKLFFSFTSYVNNGLVCNLHKYYWSENNNILSMYIIFNTKIFFNKNLLALLVKVFQFYITLVGTSILPTKIIVDCYRFHFTKTKYQNEICVLRSFILNQKSCSLKLRYFMSHENICWNCINNNIHIICK